MRQKTADLREFFRQFRREFNTTGAVAPSGPFLAKAITRPFRALEGPRRILEIGPGTGAFTKFIVRQMRDDDQFDLVEINNGFAGHLKKRFETCPTYQRVADRSHVHCVALQDFESDDGLHSYDAVISGLPLNNFSPELVTELVEASIRHVRPGGTFSMFEYMYVRPIRTRIGARRTRDRLKKIESIMQSHFAEHRFKTDWVFPNVLPAWVQHLRVGSDEPTASAMESIKPSLRANPDKVTTS